MANFVLSGKIYSSSVMLIAEILKILLPSAVWICGVCKVCVKIKNIFIKERV